MSELAIMTDEPVDLDNRSGIAQQESTEIRRRIRAVRADQEAVQERQDEFEYFLFAAPTASCPDVAAKAHHLLEFYAMALVAQEPRREPLVAAHLRIWIGCPVARRSFHDQRSVDYYRNQSNRNPESRQRCLKIPQMSDLPRRLSE